MAIPQPIKRYTAEEYLELERASEVKHEFYQGEIFAMSGASLPHNRIQMNFTGGTHAFLKGKGCDVFGSDLRVHIPSNGLFTYPDAVIACGQPELLNDGGLDNLLNPVAIIEVLSKSTQSYDRGDKFALYRAIPSLQEYILIASESVAIEQYTKQEDDTWILKEVRQLNEQLYIKTIHFSLPLTELYSGVSFEPPVT